MKVYVLTGFVQYEGEDVLGVYSTEDIAKEEIEVDRRWRKTQSYSPYDDYRICEHEVDAR